MQSFLSPYGAAPLSVESAGSPSPLHSLVPPGGCDTKNHPSLCPPNFGTGWLMVEAPWTLEVEFPLDKTGGNTLKIRISWTKNLNVMVNIYKGKKHIQFEKK